MTSNVSEKLDSLLKEYWTGDNGKSRLVKWARDIPELDKIGRNIRNRIPISATKDEFREIVKWKNEQYSELFEINAVEKVIERTREAFAFEEDLEKIKHLVGRTENKKNIYGVGVPVASAILRFVYPNSYGVVDWRNWYVLSQPDFRPPYSRKPVTRKNELFKILGGPLLQPLSYPYASDRITPKRYVEYLKVLRSIGTKYPERSKKEDELEIIKELRAKQENEKRTIAEIDMALYSYSWELIREGELS